MTCFVRILNKSNRRNRLFASGRYQGDYFKALSTVALPTEFEDNRVVRDLSKAQGRESSSLNLSHHVPDMELLVNTILKLPSLLYLRSTRSKKSQVFSASNTQYPTSSMIRQDGLTRLLMTFFLLPNLLRL
jgi:hypothetical protein